MKLDAKTDGYDLLDWVHNHNALIKPDEGRWLVVCRVTGATLGEGSKPSDAIKNAANKELLAA